MTVVSDIIKYAFRQSNLIAVGVDPTDAQQTEALFFINNIVSGVMGNEVGDPLTSFPIGRLDISRPAGYPWWDTVPDNNWFVPKNTRLMFNLEDSIDIYLHPDPDDGSRFAAIDVAGNLATNPVTVHGNGRNIENATTITLDVNNTDTEWFYRADTGNWAKSTPLGLSDEMPFPIDFDDYFITALAIKLNPSYGVSLDQQTAADYKNSRSQLVARYAQIIPMRTELALIRPAKLAADRDRWGSTYWLYNPNAMFDKGWPW